MKILMKHLVKNVKFLLRELKRTLRELEGGKNIFEFHCYESYHECTTLTFGLIKSF